MDRRCVVVGGDTTEIMVVLTRLLVDHLGIDAKDVTPAARLADDLGADIPDVIEIMEAVEHEFGGDIFDDYTLTCRTVRDIVALVLHFHARQESGDA